MNASPAVKDTRFRDNFESRSIASADFHHREHLQLAFVYLCESDVSSAHVRMRSAIKQFLATNGVPAEKYHETLTLSWLQAVRHFLARAGHISSFEQFLRVDDRLLNIDIMLIPLQPIAPVLCTGTKAVFRTGSTTNPSV